MAETAFTRMSRIRALSLEEEGRKGAHRLARHARATRAHAQRAAPVGPRQPDDERVAARCAARGLVRQRRARDRARAADRRLLRDREVAPKTFAIQHPDRAALRLTPFLWAISNFPPLRVLSSGLIGLANVLLPGRGLEGRSVRHRGGPPHDGRRRGRRAGDRTRGAASHPFDLRVRRHGRARGDGAPARHDRGRGRRDRSRTRSPAPSTPGSRVFRATRTPPTTSSGSCT